MSFGADSEIYMSDVAFYPNSLGMASINERSSSEALRPQNQLKLDCQAGDVFQACKRQLEIVLSM